MTSRRDLLKLVGKIGVVAAANILPWHVLDRLGVSGAEFVAEAASMPQNYVTRTPTLVTDFSATTGMNLTQGTGSVALDSTPAYVRTGTQSLKIVQQASASSAIADLDTRNAAFGGSGAEGFNAAQDNLWRLRCFVDVPANQNNLSFFVSNDTTAFTNYFTQNVMGPQIGGSYPGFWWDRVENRKDWTVAGGAPAWSSPVRYIRIRPNANSNGVLTTWLDALYRGGYARPKVVISFDDGSDGQITIAKPILDTYGFKGTFYVIGDTISRDVAGVMTQAQADALYAAGHDICYHAWTNNDHNNYASLTEAELIASSRNFQAWAGARGYERSRFYHAMPTGATSATIQSVMANEGYLTGRSTLRLYQNHLLGLDNARLLRGWSWASTDGTAGPIGWINNTITYGTTLLLTYHSFHATVSSGQQCSAADFTTVMQHLYRCQQANLLDVEVQSQWYQGLTTGRKRRS